MNFLCISVFCRHVGFQIKWWSFRFQKRTLKSCHQYFFSQLSSMKTFATAVLIALSLLLSSAAENIQVFFSPKGGCTEAVVENLDRATNSALIQAYSFTSAPIAKVLVDAKKRGVKVQVILDKSQRTEKYSGADFIQRAGIPTFIDGQHAIAHNKIMIIDGQIILTGSFNFTKAAEQNNAENLLVIQDDHTPFPAPS
jgi:phosphatidylserine/phosphatidylglycerophosphate/cardiolipin synthase-like enzyme